MISLRDCLEIQCAPESVFTWLEQMPQEYTSWHPDHVSCRLIRGSMLEVGSVVECEEYLHGSLHRMRFRMMKVIPNRRLEFVIERLGRGAFEVEESEEGVRFIAELDIGVQTPIIGHIFDFVFPLLFSQRIEAMRQHMFEEGQNLKAILESQ